MKKIIPLLIANALFAININAQIIINIAGSSAVGFTGDGGAATAAEMNLPSGVAVDASGNIYIAVRNNERIRKVTTSGIISTIAGGGSSLANGVQATAAQLSSPYDVALDASGNFYIADAAHAIIRKVNTSGIINTIAGNFHSGYTGDGGAATAAELGNPIGVIVDASGNFYIADQGYNCIRKVNTSGVISTFAGNGTASYSGDGGQATAAEINHPYSVNVDDSGNIYIADKMNYRIRKVNTSGVITTIAGNGISGNSGNGGAATAAELFTPTGMARTLTGKLYIVDGGANRLRMVNASGIISAAGGDGLGGYSGDSGQATAAELDGPMKAAFDNFGNIYIADQNNNRVREIYLTLSVSVTSTNVSCMGGSNGSATATANHGTTPYTYLWNPGSKTTASISGLSAGIYTVTVTDHDGITGSTTVTITQPATKPTLAANIDTILNASCFGMVNGAALGGGTGGTPPYSYLWEPLGASSDTALSLAAGSYTLQVTDSTGCSATVSAIITQPSPLTVTVSQLDSLATAIATGGTAPYTYHWYPGGSTTMTVSALSAGTYTVTVNDGNKCNDSAVFSIPNTLIGFTFGNPTITCGNPGYFNFDIMVASLDTVVFNSCIVDVEFNGSEFAGDNFTNGGIIVTQGPDFQPAFGNDYNVLDTSAIGNTLYINFGSRFDSTVDGTLLTDAPQALLHVSFKIQNSCDQEQLTFANFFVTDSNYYSITDTSSHWGKIDSLITDSLCCPYPCFDSSCMCNVSCYDTSFVITYTYGTIENYYSQNFLFATTIYSTGGLTGLTCTDSIIDHTKSINAGTNAKSVSPDPSKIPPNSSILTITGCGFGDTKDSVKVTNANDSGSMFKLDAMDILSWSENQIVIKMPSYMQQDTNLPPHTNGHTPGSGPFIIYNSCGQSVSNNIQINYNIENDYHNVPHSQEKTRPNITMIDTSESLIWRCDTSISNNPKAFACARYAIYLWNCYTGVNWKLGPPDTMAAAIHYGVSNIYVSSPINFPSHASMLTNQEFLNPCYNYNDSVSFYDAADIQVNSAISKWSYDTTGTQTSTDSNYFFDAILHELGHAIGLNHINDSFSLMYYFQIPGRRVNITSYSDYPGPATLLGGLDMVNTSAAYSPAFCPPESILKPSLRYCTDPTLSLASIPKNAFNLNLFPNPINQGFLTISYELTKNSYIQFKILDCIGRVVMTLNNENKLPGNYSEQINIDALASGIYLFTANINGEFQTIKFIKL